MTLKKKRTDMFAVAIDVSITDGIFPEPFIPAGPDFALSW
jgi:hypothetical protein